MLCLLVGEVGVVVSDARLVVVGPLLELVVLDVRPDPILDDLLGDLLGRDLDDLLVVDLESGAPSSPSRTVRPFCEAVGIADRSSIASVPLVDP